MTDQEAFNQVVAALEYIRQGKQEREQWGEIRISINAGVIRYVVCSLNVSALDECERDENNDNTSEPI